MKAWFRTPDEGGAYGSRDRSLDVSQGTAGRGFPVRPLFIWGRGAVRIVATHPTVGLQGELAAIRKAIVRVRRKVASVKKGAYRANLQNAIDVMSAACKVLTGATRLTMLKELDTE